jgi:outer membrane biosynthesis protein TonB
MREVQKNSTGPRSAPRVEIEDGDEEEDSFWVRHRAKFIAATVLLGLGVSVYFAVAGKSAPVHKAPERQVVSIQLPKLAPPPPPPPKLPPPPPPEQKLVEQTPVAEPEKKPEAEPPKSDDPPALGTNIKGPGGSDGFGLGSSGNGGLGRGGSGKAGSKYGWYAGQVQGRIGEALRNHRKTRSASLNVQVRVWPDPSGRITRAQLVGSTGDSALDRTLQSEVLTGLQLAEAPPAGMPTPIILRLSARRPN